MPLSPALVGRVRGFRPFAWYKYGVGQTIAAGKVSSWADFSGNKRDLLQATGAAQPVADGKGGITCDGIATFMQAAFTLAQPCVFALILKQIAWTSTNVIVDGGTSGAGVNGAIVQTTGSPQLNLNCGTAACASTTLPVGQWHTCIALMNGANSILYAASIAGVSGNAGTNAPGGITVGASSDGATKFGNVGIREVLVFNSYLDDGRIRLIRRYLNAQMSIFYN